MIYELAKQLKDAGFPLKGILSYERAQSDDGSDYAYVPTLTELIEACGERFGSLGRDWLDDVGSFWCAIDRGREETVPPRIERTGATPEEAVANLWLALNKK